MERVTISLAVVVVVVVVVVAGVVVVAAAVVVVVALPLSQKPAQHSASVSNNNPEFLR